jgi:16S rRNA processing protein RimM
VLPAKGAVVKELIEYIACSLVDDPTQVQVGQTRGGAGKTRLELRVAREDMGRVIGKGGRVANAMRVITARFSSPGGKASFFGRDRTAMKRRRQVPPDQSQQDPSTGSPAPGGPVFLAVGFLRRPHGLNGEILMDVLTDFPSACVSGKTVYVGDYHEPKRIASIRGHNVEKIIRFSGVETPEEAGKYRNMNMFVKADSLPELPEGEYYHHQLIGMNVVDESGQSLGRLEQYHRNWGK